MATRILRSNLDDLGLDMDSNQMHVFRSVLLAAGGTGKTATYGKIVENLETISETKYSRAYIYRQLSSLEEIGFVTIDTVHTPRTYTITDNNVETALETIRADRLASHITKRQDLTTQLTYLKSIKSQELALLLHNLLAGNLLDPKSGIIEGVENVRSTIIREFADGAKEGDLVRVLGHASTMAAGLGPGGVTELRLIQSGFRGVKIMGLLTPVGGNKMDLDIMARHLSPMVDAFEQATKTGNIQLRLTREPINTYRIVSLNEDKMLLYLTHAKESDMAALVHREDSPGLIDDALRTFDELWETGIDVLDLIKQILQK